ncbi:hypothetical protein VTN77DRAFT_8920 [Rasamsonia byssochlamydoides]|uniref:uncharacterized protein n=1 Tax=Rasamsonia byssochlamydoides TaxID=89139 RepID=UPI003743DECB
MTVENKANYGRRLAPAVLDELSKTAPDRRFGVVPNGHEVSDGFREVKIGDLAQAVNYTSWWIEKTFGRTSRPETLSYMAGNDIRYAIFVLACNKTGYTPFLPSTRNSDDAFLHLLKATDCQKFVYGAERKNRVFDIKKLRPDLEIVEIPSLSEMIEGQSPLYPYDKTYDEEEDKIAFVIHSSGTTGLPKPVHITHGYIGVFDNTINLPCPPGRQLTYLHLLGPQDLLLSTTPFFHMLGYVALIESLFHNVPFVIPPDKPLSPDLIADVMDATKPTAAVFPPSVLEEMSHSERALNGLSRLNQVYFGGAPLSPETGDKLCKVTRLLTVIGTSEVGLISTMQPLTPEDWRYYEWNPYYGVDMQFVGENMYELVIRRAPSREFQGIFHTFPELQEYRTKDVFVPHPTKPNKWIYHGRIDDVIVLSNGEKFNPVTMEKVIEGHPLVAHAVIAGQGHFQSSLLVEPNWNEWSEDKPASELIEKIWPVVQQANETGLAHGRVLKSKILVASKSKPFKITPKGSTQRQHIYKDYAEEIEALYKASGEEDFVSQQLPEKADLAGVKDYIQKVVLSILGRSEIDEKEDFYSAGLDSLQTVQLTRILQGAIRTQYPDRKSEAVTTQKIYSNPTVEQLSLFVHRIISGGDANGVVDAESRAEKIEALVKKYTDDIPVQELDVSSPAETHTVILTGSTGSLGNYLLSALLDDPSTAKVYCLNRSADAASRQKKSLLEKGLPWDSHREAKVEFLQASFGAEKFGLEASKYDEMLRSVDTIIHNAWKVDFNHSVSTFEDVHIRGVRRFVDFSLQSAHHAHIHFVSSVATIGAWNPTHGPAVPEAPVENPAVTLPQGYGESKHVAERICLAASRRAGVPTTVLRVGQVGGPTLEKGLWNRQEWLPTIIATSKATGRIPRDLGSAPVDWIPVDKLATIIIELVASRRGTQSETRCTAFNLINPHTTAWESLIPAVQRHYPHIEPVDLATWVSELEEINSTNPSEAEVAAKPALKLLDFYRGLLTTEGGLSSPIEQRQTKEASATMRNLGPVDQPLMENWLRQWAF